MKSLYLIIIVVLSQAMQGQGFTRAIEYPGAYDHFNGYRTNQIHFGETEQDVILWYSSFDNGYHEFFVNYNAETNEINHIVSSGSGPSKARYFRYGNKQYVVRNGAGGAPSARPYWEFFDFEGNKNAEFYPEYRGASSIAQRNDSLFILYSVLNNSQTDTNTLYYLTYLNPVKAREEVLDSVRIPFYLSNAGLYYHADHGYWEVLHQDYRIRFKSGNISPDTLFQDPRFAIQRFSHFGGDSNRVRETYFRKGISKVYRNFSSGEVYRITYTPFDTSYYDLSVLSPYMPAELSYIPQIGVFSDFTGSFPGLANFTREEGPIDLSFYSRYNGLEPDSLLSYRLENGIIKSRFEMQLSLLNPYRVEKVKSTADGGFYLSGTRYSNWPNGWSEGKFLIYRDESGRMSSMLDDELFNIHFDSSTRTLKLFFENPNAQFIYRIIDASGRSLQEGNFKAYEGISIGDWRTGVYYLQLWDKAGSLIGSKPFLKR